MPFPTDLNKPPAIQPETFAICLLLTCSLQIMENLLPKIPIFPWLRLGLAYWVLLPFLIRFGVFQALCLFLFRNLITLVYGGQVFSSFLISTAAGMISLLVLGTVGRFLFLHRKIGLIGFSVLLASSFNINQLVIVDRLLIRHQDFYFQLAPILLWSLVSGSLIALLVASSQSALFRLFSSTYFLQPGETATTGLPTAHTAKLPALAAIVVFGSLFLFKDWTAQAGFLVGLILITRFRNLKLLKHTWPFYFYIAWLHLFRTDGVFLVGEWITAEGLDAFLFYALRTTNIIICGQWLAKYLPLVLESIRPNRFLKGVGFALPVLPAIFGISIALGKDLFQKLKKREFENLLDPVILRLLSEFETMEDSGRQA